MWRLWLAIAFLLATNLDSVDSAKRLFTVRGQPLVAGENNFRRFFGNWIISSPTNFKHIMDIRNFRYFDQINPFVVVHYNGFITMDVDAANTIRPLTCQGSPLSTIKQTRSNFAAIYWQQYASGDVYMFRYNRNDPPSRRMLAPSQINTILKDLDNAFSDNSEAFFKVKQNGNLDIKPRDFTNKRIENVWVITWLRMVQVRETEEQEVEEQNTFQALLIEIKDKSGNSQWFLKTYFQALNSNGGKGPNCKNRAQIGIGISRDTKGRGVDFLQRFGNLLPTVFQRLSNEWKFSDQGSYSFDLNSDAINQPVPPTIRCTSTGSCPFTKPAPTRVTTTIRQPQTTTGGTTITGKPATTTTETTTTNTTAATKDLIQESLNEFCLFRNDGSHALPVDCDRFIYCAHGIGSFEDCPSGTKFNPIIRTCDFVGNFECKAEGLDVSALRPQITQPPAESNNLCFFQENGDVADPSSCDHYYSCSNTQSIRRPCPNGLFFKPITEKSGECDYRENVNCTGNGDRSGDDSNTQTTTATTLTKPATTTTTTSTTTTTTAQYHPRKFH